MAGGPRHHTAGPGEGRRSNAPVDALGAVDAQRARLTFTHHDLHLTAELVIDAAHRLMDLISDQRVIGGVRVPGYGEGVWQLPDGPIVYGRFHVSHIAHDQ
jgi:hypothetical protein